MVSSVAERDTPPASGGGSGKDQAALADWLLRLDDVARKRGCEGLVAQTGVCCWIDFFEDGYTPEAAWVEDCSNA